MGFIKRQVAPDADRRPEGRSDLLRALNSTDEDVRRHAARALARRPETASDLCARLASEPVAAVQEAILTSLMLIDSDAAVRGLLPLLRTDDASLRNAVLEALQQMAGSAGPHVRALLADPDPDIRIFAIDLLQVLRHPAAPECLAEVIARERHVNVCAAAVDRLAELGTPDMIPALRALSERFADEPYLQFAAAVAIQRIQGGCDTPR